MCFAISVLELSRIVVTQTSRMWVKRTQRIVTVSVRLLHINRRPFMKPCALNVLRVGCEASFVLVVTMAAVCAVGVSQYTARGNWCQRICR
jgi:hypothetical protein